MSLHRANKGTQRVVSGINPVLEIRDMTVTYPNRHKGVPHTAVDQVSLTIQSGEALGLVGESGSGKTTIGRAVLGLAPIRTGSVVFEGQDITNASFKDRRKLSRFLQVVFQDATGSLNPTRTVWQTLAEPLLVHGQRNRKAVTRRVEWALEHVGMHFEDSWKYPRQFSGGQRQRISIARALMMSPHLIICDEPTSALDLSIQAQLLNLLSELQHTLRLSYLFISHDLAVVRHIAQRMVVLYQGTIMEFGTAEQVYERPAHPYSIALLRAEPRMEARPLVRKEVRRTSALPHKSEPNACVFLHRCLFATDECAREKPALRRSRSGSLAACHNLEAVRG